VRRRLPAVACAASVLVLGLGWAAPPAAAGGSHPARLDSGEQCTFGGKVIPGTPWSLQRVLLNQLWQDTKGEGVRVAVIDSGVDNKNPQLRSAVDVADGADVIGGKGHGTKDPVGHGTKVAGIIAARPAKGTGFVGLAPKATIIPIRQAKPNGKGTTQALITAIHKAIEAKARVINISQDTRANNPDLFDAVEGAVDNDIVVVVSAGNAGADGEPGTTYPGAYPGVLAVGASDRNNERATFSQAGGFVGVAAPGVDMVSTVPGGGQCVDNGTSFSAPYVSGVAALIRAKHPRWKAREVIAQIEQTAQRTDRGRNLFVGWGVVDPVRALTDDSKRIEAPTKDPAVRSGYSKPVPAALTIGETPHERQERIATYVLGTAVVSVFLVAGTAVVLRDHRRRRRV
jgi:membrane-anchored mycosin MYCP